MPPCPSWVEAFKENRAALHVHAIDAISHTPACAAGQAAKVTVYLDEQPVALGEIPCLDDLRAPAASYRLDGGNVTPGMHELRVEVQAPGGRGRGASALVSLPAFDIPPDGQTIAIGAEVPVEIGPDDVTIGPPQVYPPKGL
ncbi:MAG: hypothetical protein KF819_11150 [Labilithrix sp.]|nr:hypothetical protein [Labilithrix sp.]